MRSIPESHDLPIAFLRVPHGDGVFILSDVVIAILTFVIPPVLALLQKDKTIYPNQLIITYGQEKNTDRFQALKVNGSLFLSVFYPDLSGIDLQLCKHPLVNPELSQTQQIGRHDDYRKNRTGSRKDPRLHKDGNNKSHIDQTG